MSTSAPHFDHIVVGAGSAGAVIAARLAERTERTVLLVEAGPDYHPAALPGELRNGRTPALGSHDWGYTARGAGAREFWFPRGRVVGGCSAINSCIALRPEPADVDGWPSGGLDWSWPAVAEAFAAVEADTGERPGRHGPVRLTTIPAERMTPLSRAFHAACTRAGFAAVADHNEPGSSGVGPLPLNVDGALRRISTATAFLQPVRQRPNLTVLADSTVDSVVFAGSRATGIRVSTGGRARYIAAERITVSAGAFGSPAILLRSGIGPAAELRALGIDVVADLPAVGRGLADHAQVPLVCAPTPGAIDTSAPCAEVVLRYRAPGSAAANDMQLCLLNHVELAKYSPGLAREIAGRHAFVITANLLLPDSRGTVRLASRDAGAAPVVHLDHVRAPADLDRLRDGLRLARQVAMDQGFRPYTDGVCGIAGVSFGDDRSVEEYVAREVQTAHHPTGTAAMASTPDGGVVDGECRVFGTEGLHVADASIIPSPVRANTNLTCMMIGERVAGLLAGTSTRESTVERV